MKIKSQYKVREMAGEHVVIMQGKHGSDLTNVISLNDSAYLLWQAVEGRDFTVETLVEVLTENYEIDAVTAERDAQAWIKKLEECGLAE
jgi:hypothetical protein